ncbi:hypothetical protein O9H85_10890 [Paenibacillus filicis]|uniref:Uncharacterized protein n=1 Tax=Paenibacillus gyeongsangnamensis TaxID=3388067 RepID=A0ABT4Q7R1_9BACL|nr:hypothetical protein [Paenibacillus filicis]MCZ8512915.1 hypothetical protein [Paenibacillus filicis]
MEDHHHEKESADGYEDMFITFSGRVEKILAVLVLGALAALVLSQLLLQSPHLRYLLVKVEQLEGKPYRSAGSAYQKDR